MFWDFWNLEFKIFYNIYSGLKQVNIAEYEFAKGGHIFSTMTPSDIGHIIGLPPPEDYLDLHRKCFENAYWNCGVSISPKL